jgi:cation transport ATPase
MTAIAITAWLGAAAHARSLDYAPWHLGVAALTLSGHATLLAAIAADMGVSLLVIANGLRLLRG